MCAFRFYMSAEDLNSGLHAYMSSTLAMEPSSQPLELFLKGNGWKAANVF